MPDHHTVVHIFMYIYHSHTQHISTNHMHTYTHDMCIYTTYTTFVPLKLFTLHIFQVLLSLHLVMSSLWYKTMQGWSLGIPSEYIYPQTYAHALLSRMWFFKIYLSGNDCIKQAKARTKTNTQKPILKKLLVLFRYCLKDQNNANNQIY